MGGNLKRGIFQDNIHLYVDDWVESSKSRAELSRRQESIAAGRGTQIMNKMAQDNYHTVAQEMLPIQEATISITELPFVP